MLSVRQARCDWVVLVVDDTAGHCSRLWQLLLAFIYALAFVFKVLTFWWLTLKLGNNDICGARLIICARHA